jgi:hypothetical protein
MSDKKPFSEAQKATTALRNLNKREYKSVARVMAQYTARREAIVNNLDPATRIALRNAGIIDAEPSELEVSLDETVADSELEVES